MKRFVITAKSKEIRFIEFVVPSIKELQFNSPMELGSYCAHDGSLWTSLDDGKSIFEDENKAKDRLAEIIQELFL
jgi:hypothetical protein